MKAGRLLAVAVAVMMIFGAAPLAVHAGDPPQFVWVAEEWNVDGDNITDEGFEYLELGFNAFESIQEAIDAVAENGIVNVLPGTYEVGDAGEAWGGYSLRITKDGITVQGVRYDKSLITDYEDADIPVIEALSYQAPGISYRIDADNVTFSGLRILPKPDVSDNLAQHVLWVTGKNFTLENCLIDYVAGSDGNLRVLRFDGEDAISANIEGNKLVGTIYVDSGAGESGAGEDIEIKDNVIIADGHFFALRFLNGAGENARVENNTITGYIDFQSGSGQGAEIIGNTIDGTAVGYSLDFRDAGSAQGIKVEGNVLIGRVQVLYGAGAGSKFYKNTIDALGSRHFSFWNVPGEAGSPGLASVIIGERNKENKLVGEANWGFYIESYDGGSNHPDARWMSDFFNNNEVDEAYMVIEDLSTFKLREVSALSSYIRGYSSFVSARNDAQDGDTIFSFLSEDAEGIMTLLFDPDEMPNDSSLALISLGGPPAIFVPMAGIAGGGDHTITVQLSWDDGGLPIPEQYEFVRRMVLSIVVGTEEIPYGDFGEDDEGHPQIWVPGELLDYIDIDADALLLLRYDEVSGEWEVQEKEIDADGTVIFTTPKWSDFVFVQEQLIYTVTFEETTGLEPTISIAEDTDSERMLVEDGEVDLEDGEYYFFAELEGYENLQGTFTVAGENKTVEFTMTAEAEEPAEEDPVVEEPVEEEPVDEVPETGTGIMWLIPFGLLVLAGGVFIRRRVLT